jgi:signal transduction histidine kinase
LKKLWLAGNLPEQVNILKDFESFSAVIDPDKITQVIINLVSMQGTLMPPEGGTIYDYYKERYKSFLLIIEDQRMRYG